MKTLALILAPLLCAAAGRPGVDALIDQAGAVPGEFAADALIRIAAIPEVGKPTKIQLLEEAFRRAAEAQEPYKRRSAMLRIGAAARALSRAYLLDLDALSLRLRAVEALLPLDGRKARELFGEIPPLNLPSVTCDDYMVYDVDRYYDALGAVASQTFTAKEIERGEAYQLLALHASTISSPVEAAPMARLLASAHVKDGEFQALVSAFAGSLGRIRGDDRSFTASSPQTGSSILALAEECKRRLVPSLPLIEAYRLYLVNHVSAERCADDDLVAQPQTASSADGDPVAFFNNKLRVDPIQAIAPSDAAAASVEGAATGLRTCDDPECKAIASQYRGLVLAANGTPYPNSFRKTAEWRDKFDEFLAAMDGWRQSTGITAAEHFREKTAMYSDVANMVMYPEREVVLRALLRYLERSGLQAENRIEWFLPVNALVAHVGIEPAPLARLAAELRGSSDPVIALYANLETAAPRSPGKTILLM